MKRRDFITLLGGAAAWPLAARAAQFIADRRFPESALAVKGDGGGGSIPTGPARCRAVEYRRAMIEGRARRRDQVKR